MLQVEYGLDRRLRQLVLKPDAYEWMAITAKAVWMAACPATFDHSFQRTEGEEVVQGGAYDKDDVA